jgi:glucosyl-3-phosphoglycerate synthase
MISVIVPALNESANISSVVGFALQSQGVKEVIVVDDGSVDGTQDAAASAGARVITSSLLGKGTSMEDGLRAAQHDLLVYLDGDLRGLREDLISILTEPLLEDRADFVKASFTREAGRVTTLTARPLLQTFFPELSHFQQPLGGIIAARRQLLSTMSFETDYGVDLGLLIDCSMKGARIEEVFAGHLDHDSQSLDALGEMAKQVVRTLLQRAVRHGRLSTSQIDEMQEVERFARAEPEVALSCLRNAQRIALFDMDGTLVQGRTIVNLARAAGRETELRALLDNPSLDPELRTREIAAVLKDVPKSLFESTAREIPLTDGAAETIVGLRKRGYRVGIVSDSYRVITETIRRRVFADFSLAHLMRFQNGRSTGRVTFSPLMLNANGCPEHRVCKLNVLMHLEHKFMLNREHFLTVGDSENDICIMRNSGVPVAFEPKSPEVAAAARHHLTTSLYPILDLPETQSLER